MTTISDERLAEMHLRVAEIVRRYADDAPPVWQFLHDGEDRLLVDYVSALRAQGQTYPAAWMVRENERDSWDFVRMKKAADDLRERGFEVIALYLEASPAPVREEITDEDVERAMKAFALIAHDMTPQQYAADRAAADKTPISRRRLEKSLRAMRAALTAKGGQHP